MCFSCRYDLFYLKIISISIKLKVSVYNNILGTRSYNTYKPVLTTCELSTKEIAPLINIISVN